MPIIATVSIPREQIALGATMAVDPEATVELDRVVPTGQTVVPYLWTPQADVDPVTTGLRGAEEVESVVVVDDTGEQALLRVEWTEPVDGVLEAVASTGACIIAGVGQDGMWRLQLRFDDHDSSSEFFRRCSDGGVAVTLDRIHSPGLPEGPEGAVQLSDAQREALETALEAGYFEVPRQIGLAGLADRLDISDSALSERLRRGTAALLRDELGRPGRPDG